IYREETNDQSRVDFSFKSKNREILYIVEIKKWDGNHHFDYNEKYKAKRFGYITDYNLLYEQKKECELKKISYKTWREFSKKIKSQSAPYPLIAFNEYLKLVCNIREIRKMNLLEVNSLIDFSHVLDEIIFSKFVKENNLANRANMRQGYYGWYCNKYIWFGLIFEINQKKREPFIAVTIDKEGYSTNHLTQIDVSRKKMIGEVDKSNDGMLIFPLKLVEFEKFNKIENVDKQKELLNEFFQECIDLIEEQKIADIK
ncbi:hypothetical protein CH354_07635, partial [Leptospira levettii]|uniref:hypothetical protein n=1 Tax=Leptospira levettii TaxID=2023178 RepID=UPI000CBB04FC